MVFHGHLQGRSDNRLVALKLPKINVRGAVQLIDFASAFDEHPVFKHTAGFVRTPIRWSFVGPGWV
jgi:hypothetical protein